MNWRTPVFIGAAVLILLLVVGAYLLGANRTSAPQAQSSNTPIPQRPQAIKFQTNATPIIITSLSPLPTTNLFAHPDQPAYEPGKGFTPDAQRVLDITALQISLEKYHAAKGRYPPSLSDLFPTFAPVENGQPIETPPVDPETRRPYEYQALAGGSDYQLTATLSSGEHFTGIKRTN